ncbi:unnamed protein product, partial [marine sediment metagenome]
MAHNISLVKDNERNIINPFQNSPHRGKTGCSFRNINLGYVPGDNSLGMEPAALLGKFNCNVKEIEKSFSASVIARGEIIRIEGTNEEVEQVRSLFNKLIDVVKSEHVPSLDELRYLIRQVKEGRSLDGVLSDVVRVTHWGEEIRAKTAGQHSYIEAIRSKDIVFSIGPAGTGKTYLAVAMAIDYLKTGKVKRIILTRPAVEAGEEL